MLRRFVNFSSDAVLDKIFALQLHGGRVTK
jgi:hypothetical protein